LQRLGYSDRATPGAEILGGEALTRDLLQVIVYVVRLNFAQLPVFVDVLKEFVSRQAYLNVSRLYEVGCDKVFV